ncbi:MAG: YkgJ family cysteine cluster protein [Candidatus Hermodarchaeota archaeon]
MRNTNDLRFQCVHCGNCCTDSNTLVNTTYADIHRIRDGLDLTMDEVIEILGFYIFEKKPSAEEIAKMVVPPIETERGLAFVGLKKHSNGQCYFYNIKKKRCSIYDVRPNFCRTFPFTFKLLINKENSKMKTIRVLYTEKGLEYCQGIGNNAPIIQLDKWTKLGQDVIEDLTNNGVLAEKWNDSVKNGVITPSVRNFISTIFNLL